MEITGPGNNFIPSKPEKAETTKSSSGFQQVLNKAVTKKSPKQPVPSSNDDKQETKAAKALLSFLKKDDIREIADGNQGIIDDQANSQLDRLQIVKNLLGISDEKWSEIIAELESRIKGKLRDQDPIIVLIEGLASLGMNQSLTGLKENGNQSSVGLNNNMILFLKAAKIYSLLPNQGLSSKQLLTGMLDSVRDQLQGAVQNNQTQSKRTYLQNTFSQLVSEMKNQTTGGSAEVHQSNAVNRLTDWQGNSPFFQLMSKPEQLALMTGGTQSAVSVNDLIQQFESILSKSQFSKMGGAQKLFIQLNPEHLGSISIELIQKDQLLTARILTTTAAAKEALELNLHNLKHAFEAQSIKVDNVEIGQQATQSQPEDFLNRDQRNQQEQPQDQEQQQETSGNGDSTSGFILTLEEAILNQEV